MILSRNNILSLILAVAAAPLFGQVSVSVQKAELSVPFGVAAGQLVSVGEYLVFTDQEQPEASFAVARTGLRDFSVAGDLLTIETIRPVKDRSGERAKLTFRLGAPVDSSKLTAWYKAGPVPTAPAGAEPAKPAAPEVVSYQVRHNHLMGGCNGRLIIEASRVVFESITDINHSRQWGLKDIKELKRDNPYEIKVVPFSGDTYNLGIQGRGMDSDEYRVLVDKITAARTQ